MTPKGHALIGENILNGDFGGILGEVDVETFKVFLAGPDAFISTNYKLFTRQHNHHVRLFFETLLWLIKMKNLGSDPRVKSILYGYLCHYYVDVKLHQLIIYMTGDKKNHRMTDHALAEMWIDDYLMDIFGDKRMFYYRKWYLKDNDLRELIDEVYLKVFRARNAARAYSRGIFNHNLLDSLVRTNAIGVAPLILTAFNIGDIIYRGPERAQPYLNLKKEEWTRPSTGEICHDSFWDLVMEAKKIFLEAIEATNRYMFNGGNLLIPLVSDNISYITGLPCGQSYAPQNVKKII